jgi:putative tricarboxylic transport membrane protein
MRKAMKLRPAAVVAAFVILGTACQGGAGPAGKPAAGKAATNFPEKQITVINAYSPGGGTDIMFRNIDAVSQKIKAFPQAFIVETKTGGNGTVGKAAAVNAKPDGYTLTVADDGNMYQDLAGEQPFAYNDFTFIARMVIDYNMLVVRDESPFRTFQNFVDAAKARPKGVSVAGTNIGSTDQVQLVQITKAAGIDVTYTPFNSGGDVATNLLGGHVDAAMANPSEVWEQMRAGKVRALAITAPERLKDLPDVPTLKEVGVDLVVSQFRGIAGPKGIPDDVVAVLEEGFKKVAESPEWKAEYLDKFQQINGFMGSTQFATYMGEQYALNEVLFKELGLYKK